MIFEFYVKVTKVFNMLFMVNDGVFVHFDAFTTHARLFHIVLHSKNQIVSYCINQNVVLEIKRPRDMFYLSLNRYCQDENMNFHDFS